MYDELARELLTVNPNLVLSVLRDSRGEENEMIDGLIDEFRQFQVSIMTKMGQLSKSLLTQKEASFLEVEQADKLFTERGKVRAKESGEGELPEYIVTLA